MARLKALEPEDFPPEMKAMAGDMINDKAQLGVTRIWAQRPDLAAAYKRMIGEMIKASILPRRLIELVRLRVAFHNQCKN
jgi:alkylhydroperoxidase family enzyme